MLVHFSFLTFTVLVPFSASLQQPNIVFILTDDQGYYDVGYRGSEVLTPHIDELAAAGVKLENYYTSQLCSPSRSVLLTGRYEIHTGMQHSVLLPGQKFGVPLELPTLFETLQDLGYATQMVGKWHLGYHTRDYVPTSRGFETFFGLYNSIQDHYTKENDGAYDLHYDVRDDLNIAWNNSIYSTQTFADKAVDIITNHDQRKPLLLYFPLAAPHFPLQAPEEYLELYSWIEDPSRRTLNAMLTCVDDAVRNVTDALKQMDMFENTIIIYTSDNGGEAHFAGSNWPFRGEKSTYYEGGLKVPTFVSSPLLSSPRAISNELIHVSDWFPTLVHLAGGDTEDLEIDGYNQWDTICCGQPSPRNEILHIIDPLETLAGENIYPDTFDVRVTAAIRIGDWKLLTGNQSPPPIGERPPLPPVTDQNYHQIQEITEDNGHKYDPEKNIWLFNIADDPTESVDLSDSHPEIVMQLLERLAFYNSTAWEAVDYEELRDPDYDPINNGGAHFPWL